MGQPPRLDSPFLGRRHGVHLGSIEMVVPSNGSQGEGRGGDGGSIRSKGSFGGRARARRGSALGSKIGVSTSMQPKQRCMHPIEMAWHGRWPPTSSVAASAETEVGSDHTWGILIALFLAPARLRVERKQDLASILETYVLSCLEVHGGGEGAIGCESREDGGQTARRKMRLKMRQGDWSLFRNGRALIG